jgi:hypothetical protein
MESDRAPHYRPAACVIAQIYPSGTFVTSRFPTGKEYLGARFKN